MPIPNCATMTPFVILLAIHAGYANAKPPPPSISTDGTDITFSYGAAQSVSVADIMSQLAAATKPRVTGTGDLTKTVEIKIGTMPYVRLLSVSSCFLTSRCL